MQEQAIIRANRLAWAGLLPFIGLTALAIFTLWQDLMVHAFLVYSAVILSFLGGIHWGLAMREGVTPVTARLLLCMAPPLVGWFSVGFLPDMPALAVMGFSYLIWLKYDLNAVSDDWYEKLRKPITFVAAGTHFIMFTVVATAEAVLPA